MNLPAHLSQREAANDPALTSTDLESCFAMYEPEFPYVDEPAQYEFVVQVSAVK
jgi:hypothetical protein